MSEYKFIFDLDSTLTKEEILPRLSKYIGKYDSVSKITDEGMLGNISFEDGFTKRVDILKEIPINKAQEIINNIDLNEKMVEFISENRDRCLIVTGNLDVWIDKLMKKLGMEHNYYSSKALVNGDKIESISEIIRKEDIVKTLGNKIVAIGDGSNDAKMIEIADIGIGFGGVRPISKSVLEVCDYAFYEEETLCHFLRRLL